MAIIINTLSKQAAADLFAAEAILFGTLDGVPEHRIVELFGEWAGEFIVKHIHYKGYLDGNYNAWGACNDPEYPFIHYLYRDGFYKIVSEHNYRLTVQAMRANESGKFVAALWDARYAEQEAREEEEERKRQERNEKRKTARAAKLAAQNGEKERG